MGRFVSQAQWRAMHARYGHTGWVKRRSQKQRGQFHALPKKKRGGSKKARNRRKGRKKR